VKPSQLRMRACDLEEHCGRSFTDALKEKMTLGALGELFNRVDIRALLLLTLVAHVNGCATAPHQSGQPRGALQVFVHAVSSAGGTTVSVRVMNNGSDAIFAVVAPLIPRGNTRLPFLYYGGGGNLCVVQAVVRQPPMWEQGAPNMGIHVRRVEAGATLQYQFTIPEEIDEQVDFNPVFDRNGEEARKSEDDQDRSILGFVCKDLVFIQGFWRCKDLRADGVESADAYPFHSPLSSSVPGKDQMIGVGYMDFASLSSSAALSGRARTIINAAEGFDEVNLVDIQEVQAVSVHLSTPITVHRRISILGWHD
jgi:hypothetical protein